MYTINEALQRVADLKKDYDSNLKGKTFLYVYIDRNTVCSENVPFKEENYLHLTGLDYKGVKTCFLQTGRKLPTHAKEFYYGLDNPASIATNVSFAQGRTPSETQRIFNQTQNKLNNLSKLVQIAKKAEYIGNYQGNQNFDLVVNRSQCSLAIQNFNGINCPVSLLNGGIERLTSLHQKILAIFCKENEHSPFILSYLNKSINIGKNLFSKELSMLISHDSFSNSKTKFNEKSLCNFINSFEISVRKYLSQDLEKIAELRNHVYDSEEAYDRYTRAWKYFSDIVDNIFKAEIALEILAEQYKNKPDSLISEEYRNISNKFSNMPAPELSSNIMKFETNMFRDTLPDNILAVSAPDSFRNAIRSLTERLGMFMQNIAGKIQKTLTTVLSKPQDIDTAPPESAPANENAERNPDDDRYYIIMDNAGIQSYGNYITIISANELDFHVPITYEAEQIQKNQDMEQEFPEEKTPAPECRNKKTEYDDL
ncbi:MAG: hypothetical protein K2L10_02735 [Ruminococcus sp.]|nr:hypothetical protein [Ruminococcus sp.]